MKISELLPILEKALNEHGDVDAYTVNSDEYGNTYDEIEHVEFENVGGRGKHAIWGLVL